MQKSWRWHNSTWVLVFGIGATLRHVICDRLGEWIALNATAWNGSSSNR